MKKQFHSIASAFTLSLFALSAFAQETDKNVAQKNIGENGTPNLITFNEKSTYKNSDFQKIFQDQLGLKQNQKFSRIKTESDKQGFTHEKFQMFHNGIKVEFAMYSMHSKNGKLTSMSGEFYNIKEANTTPSLSAEMALNKAMSHIGAKHYLWENPSQGIGKGYAKPQGELVLLPSMEQQGDKRTSDHVRLAYKFDIYATEPVSRGDIYIDAVTGESLFYNATIKHFDNFGHTSEGVVSLSTLAAHEKEQEKANVAAQTLSALVAGNAATRYSGAKVIETTRNGVPYNLLDNTRGNGIHTLNTNRTNGSLAANITEFSDADNNWTAAEFNNANRDNAALDAHWGAEVTYDFWLNTFNRNSYNNQGAAINSYVHFDEAPGDGVGMDNAFWTGNEMLYGDGNVLKVLTSLDVCAHEIGHAICTNTANLAYQRESGAMNEGFSDIWGACVEFSAAPNKSRWLIGEDLEQRQGHVALRSMSNPKAEGQPDTYGGVNWLNPNCGVPNRDLNDYCGVHTNSGVLNHWFYILTEGKAATNDIGSVYNVVGIGIDKAARIAFRTESLYLGANSTFANARTFAIQSATELYGAGSAEVIATTNAFYAVGVGPAYVGPVDAQAPTAPTNLAASATTQTTTNLTWTASADNVGVTGYNVYKNGVAAPIATVAGTNHNVTGLTASTAYTFSVKARDAAGNVSVASNVVNVNTLAPAADTVAPSAPTNLAASATTQTTTNLTWTASADNVGVTGYNVYKNGVAAPIATVAGTNYNVTGLTASTAYTFSVKAKDAAGNISTASNTVNVNTLAAADTVVPTAPTNLVASGTTQTTTNLTWTASADNVGVTGYNVYKNGVAAPIATVAGTNYNVTGLTAGTDYTFSVKAKDAAGNISVSSNVVNVKTSSAALAYCTSKGNSVRDEYIDYVAIGGISNATGANAGYGNFTNLVGNLSYGDNALTVSAGFTGVAYTEYWAVWIDFNKNGVFETTEKVESGSSSSSANLAGTVTVPATALAGTTRMRVSMKYNAAQTACETFGYGEVEDYTVNIGGAAVSAGILANEIGNEENIYEFNIYPNPVENTLKVSVQDDRKTSFKIYNLMGQEVKGGNMNQTEINVSNLASGLYIFEMNDGQKTITKKFVKK